MNRIFLGIYYFWVNIFNYILVEFGIYGFGENFPYDDLDLWVVLLTAISSLFAIYFILKFTVAVVRWIFGI